jgi:hypothetical protein
MVKVAFTLTMDGKIKIIKQWSDNWDRNNCLKGNGNALGKDLAAEGSGNVSYSY